MLIKVEALGFGFNISIVVNINIDINIVVKMSVKEPSKRLLKLKRSVLGSAEESRKVWELF